MVNRGFRSWAPRRAAVAIFPNVGRDLRRVRTPLGFPARMTLRARLSPTENPVEAPATRTHWHWTGPAERAKRSAMHPGATTKRAERQAAIESALRTVAFEQAGMVALAEALTAGLAEPFSIAVETLSVLRGRVIVTGVGKSG